MELTPDRRLLTIAIPTFNRPEQLRRLVSQCLRQLDERVVLLILDNASDRDVREELADLVAETRASGVSVIRHAVNIGGPANVLRCFEYADTPWVWVIGDDDELEDSAVAIVMDAIATFPDALDLNFATTLLSHIGIVRNQPTECRGLDELVTRLDSFANLLFMSANVYRRSSLVSHMRVGVFNVSSFAPHLAMMIAKLQDEEGLVCLLPSRIVKWGSAEGHDRWDANTVYRGFYDLLYLVDNEATRVRLGHAMRSCPFAALSVREYLIRLAFDRSVDRSLLRDEFLRSLALETVSSGTRRGLFIGGLALSFEAVIRMGTFVFRFVKHGLKAPALHKRYLPTSRSATHPRH